MAIETKRKKKCPFWLTLEGGKNIYLGDPQIETRSGAKKNLKKIRKGPPSSCSSSPLNNPTVPAGQTHRQKEFEKNRQERKEARGHFSDTSKRKRVETDPLLLNISRQPNIPRHLSSFAWDFLILFFFHPWETRDAPICGHHDFHPAAWYSIPPVRLLIHQKQKSSSSTRLCVHPSE